LSARALAASLAAALLALAGCAELPRTTGSVAPDAAAIAAPFEI
jgi:hypothetical protein